LPQNVPYFLFKNGGSKQQYTKSKQKSIAVLSGTFFLRLEAPQERLTNSQ